MATHAEKVEKLRLVPVYLGLIRPEQALECPLYTVDGTLLAQKGVSLDAEAAVKVLRHGTIYTPKSELLTAMAEYRARRGLTRAENDCAYHMPGTYKRLDNLLEELQEVYTGKIEDVKGAILAIGFRLMRICDEQKDAVLSRIHVEGQSRDAIKHALFTSVLCFFSAQYLEWKEEEIQSLVYAALSMNISLGAQTKYHTSQKIVEERNAHYLNHSHESAVLLASKEINDERWLEYIRQHHEVPDGSGFPSGLKGRDILWGSSILRICSEYCARVMGFGADTMDMPAHIFKGLVKENASFPLLGLVCDALIKILGIYPIGCVVRLRNKEVAVVIRQSAQAHTPIVRSIINEKGVWWLSPMVHSTDQPSFSIVEVIRLDLMLFDVNLQKFWS